MHNITSHSVRELIVLVEKRSSLASQLSAVDTDIIAVLSGPVGAGKAIQKVELPISSPLIGEKKTQAKPRGKSSPAAPNKAAAPGKNDDMMHQLVGALEAAGDDGLTIPEIAAKLSVSESVIDTLIRPFAKPGKKSKKSAGKKPTKRGPKPGAKPGGTKARILALLEAAGSNGLSTREISKKLNLSLAGVGVWFGSTGKSLTSKLAPGHYALKS